MIPKYKYLITGLLLVIAASSCKKNWLDVSSSSQIKAEDQFKQESGFKDALMGVYITMAGPTLYSRDLTWSVMDLLAQQYNTLPSSARYADVQQYKYQSSRAVPYLDPFWSGLYNSIANINAALTYIDKNKSVLKPIDYALIKGELTGLRAFLHFDLLRLYGYGNISGRSVSDKLTVPYVLDFDKNAAPQLTYTQTFDLLQKDISAALELLKEDPVYQAASRPEGYYDEVNRTGFYNNRQQRMNYYAVRALEARFLLWRGGADNLAIARVAAEDVINNSPASLINPVDIGNSRMWTQEHIFSLNVNGFADIIGAYFNADVANVNALFMLPAIAEGVFETQKSNVGQADRRYTSLMLSQSRGLAPVKLINQSGGTVVNTMPLIKLPEMYYIAAECYLGTDLGKAIQYLNEVRASRGIIEEIPSAATRQEVEEELYKEYRKEFVSEGQLFFYYKRLGKTTIPGLALGTVVGDNIYNLPYPDNEVEFGNREQQ